MFRKAIVGPLAAFGLPARPGRATQQVPDTRWIVGHGEGVADHLDGPNQAMI